MDAFGIMLATGMLFSMAGYIVYKIGVDDKYSRHADTVMRRDIIWKSGMALSVIGLLLIGFSVSFL